MTEDNGAALEQILANGDAVSQFVELLSTLTRLDPDAALWKIAIAGQTHTKTYRDEWSFISHQVCCAT